MKTIDPKDAMILEEHEQLILRNRRTRRAINQRYKSEFGSNRGRKLKRGSLDIRILEEEKREPRYQSRPFTKKRRNLPGKRHWKNKDEQYKQLEADMLVQEYNSKQKANAALERVFKARAQKKPILIE